MSGTRKGILLGAIQIALVLSVGGKLLYDRVTRPRVWVQSEMHDPELPVRGRYLSERLRMPTEGFTYTEPTQARAPYFNYGFMNRRWAYLEVRNGQLIAKQQGSGPGVWVSLQRDKDNYGTIVALSDEPVLVFVSEHADVPSLTAGQEMWVEVTVPKQGPPRPIRIGIRKDGVIAPLEVE